jgi:hypothetical protein
VVSDDDFIGCRDGHGCVFDLEGPDIGACEPGSFVRHGDEMCTIVRKLQKDSCSMVLARRKRQFTVLDGSLCTQYQPTTAECLNLIDHKTGDNKRDMTVGPAAMPLIIGAPPEFSSRTFSQPEDVIEL